MKIEIKCLDGNCWINMPIEKLKGSSILEYMADEMTPTVAAIYDGEKPVFFLSNTDKHSQMMRGKGHVCFSTSEFQAIMSAETQTFSKMVVHTFPGSSVVDIRRAEVQESFA